MLAVAWTALFVSTAALAAPGFRNGGGGGGGRFGGGYGGGGYGGRPERVEPRQDPRQMQPPQRQYEPPGGGRMSPDERRQLREQIREHGPAYQRDRRQ